MAGPNVLTTLATDDDTLATEAGNPFPVHLVPASALVPGGVEPFSLVFRPGGVAGPNVFPSFTALYAVAALIAGGIRCVVDDSIVSPAVVPAGTYAFNSWHFEGIENVASNSGVAVLNFAAGVRIAPNANIFIESLEVHYLDPAVACITNASAAQETNVICSGDAVVQCDAGGLFMTCTNGFAALLMEGGTVGDGTHAVVSGTAPGVMTIAAYLNCFVFSNTMAAGTAQLFWDNNVPGQVQGAGTTSTQVDGYLPADAGNWGIVPVNQSGALDIIASAAANHAQATSAVAGPANPLDSATLAFTPRVSGKVRVWASTCCGSAAIDDLIQATLLLDGGAVAGAPTPQASATLAGDKVTLTLEWDVTTTLAAHTFAIRASGAGALTGTQQVVKAQELLA